MPPTGYARHFIASNRHDLSRFAPLYIGDKRYGHVRRELAARLPQETGLFVPHKDGIALAPTFDSFATRSDALMQATSWIAAHYNKPLRDEMYAVVENWGDEPLAQIDRVAVPWFGVRAWGVHVNGFVRKADGIHLWIGERAADRPADPGKLDNLIGGGQPIGLTLEQNLCKEAHEEAGIDAALALTATLAPPINYLMERGDGLRTDTLFIFDLELPESFVPRNTDGEVAAFHLMPLPDVAAIIRDTDRFKFNCNLVIIAFMLRHGFITAKDAEYAMLKEWLSERRDRLS
jgi:8-oxo-dGTP pyrophosphatase MutT (NUDIX family)